MDDARLFSFGSDVNPRGEVSLCFVLALSGGFFMLMWARLVGVFGGGVEPDWDVLSQKCTRQNRSAACT